MPPLHKLHPMKYAILVLCCSFSMLSAQAQTTDSTSKKKEEFLYVEEMPKAGYDLNEYLSKNIKYPNSARRKGIEGRVIVKFVVRATGEIDSVRIAKGIDEKCDAEALRVVRNMTAWKPGKQNGKAVDVYFTLPINFRLEDDVSPGSRVKKKGLPRN